jgi:hypothetical protein
MRTATAVIIMGGGVAALWAIASSRHSSGSQPIAPGSTVTRDDVNASILKGLAEVEAIRKKAAGQ